MRVKYERPSKLSKQKVLIFVIHYRRQMYNIDKIATNSILF